MVDQGTAACARCARLRRQPTGMQSGRGNNFVVSCILLGQFFTGLVVLFSVVYGVVPEVSNATMLLIDLICRASPSRFLVASFLGGAWMVNQGTAACARCACLRLTANRDAEWMRKQLRRVLHAAGSVFHRIGRALLRRLRCCSRGELSDATLLLINLICRASPSRFFPSGFFFGRSVDGELENRRLREVRTLEACYSQ